MTWSELKDSETDAYENGATLTMSLFELTPKNPIAAGPAVLKGGGLVGIPCTAHGLIEDDYIRIEGSQKYNNEFTVHADTTANEIVITHAQDAETFLGTERIFIGKADGTDISLPYTGTPGLYRGTLPDTLQRMVEYTSQQAFVEPNEDGKYYLFIEAVNGASRTTKRVALQAKYDS